MSIKSHSAVVRIYRFWLYEVLNLINTVFAEFVDMVLYWNTE